METRDRDSTYLLLATSATFALSLLGLSAPWDALGWNSSTAIFFVPVFLASVYSGLHWFDVNTSSSLFGVTPRVWWLAAGVMLSAIFEPGILVLACVLAIGWWFRRQFQRAEEIAEAKTPVRR
ncbi:hypothetical protein Enr13x_67440 [Stieleria neptunia]|uniref:Uncharacterized protein n=1 Tax=Stieleria neptunia TaxID=2527979 RepID=A0A518I136_9BACT|nr:hypothetical protein [Stieleria neptunia]QDV46835.1 hypothetical protein Enr13x_67440 [Stieleria neptunia]